MELLLIAGGGGGAPMGVLFSCITGKLVLLFGGVKTLFRYSEGLTRSFSPFLLLGNLGGTKGRTGVPLAFGSS